MSGGALIFLVVVLVIVAGLALTAYSRRGSGITEEADDGQDGAPGAKSHPGESHQTGDPTAMDTRGTR